MLTFVKRNDSINQSLDLWLVVSLHRIDTRALKCIQISVIFRISFIRCWCCPPSFSQYEKLPDESSHRFQYSLKTLFIFPKYSILFSEIEYDQSHPVYL